jgi:hypothetical protein
MIQIPFTQNDFNKRNLTISLLLYLKISTTMFTIIDSERLHSHLLTTQRNASKKCLF